jgi:hypothetical protein
MKTFLLLLFFLGASHGKDTTIVYVCNSPHARKYHLRTDCRGLRNCQYKIVKVSLEEARKSGKTLCGWEK